MPKRVKVFTRTDRLYFQSPGGASTQLALEIAAGIRVEPAAHGRLLLTDGKTTWIGALAPAVRLGWCRVVGDDSDSEPGGLSSDEPSS